MSTVAAAAGHQGAPGGAATVTADGKIHLWLPPELSPAARAIEEAPTGSHGGDLAGPEATQHIALLKLLRANGSHIETALVAYDRVQAELETLSRAMRVAIGVDRVWRDSEPNAVKCLQHFITTVRAVRSAIASAVAGGSARSNGGGGVGVKIMVSDHAHSTATGIAVVPWNVEVQALRAALCLASR